MEEKKSISTFGSEFNEVELMALIIRENKVLKKKVLDRIYEAKERNKGQKLAPEKKD